MKSIYLRITIVCCIIFLCALIAIEAYGRVVLLPARSYFPLESVKSLHYVIETKNFLFARHNLGSRIRITSQDGKELILESKNQVWAYDATESWQKVSSGGEFAPLIPPAECTYLRLIVDDTKPGQDLNDRLSAIVCDNKLETDRLTEFFVEP